MSRSKRAASPFSAAQFTPTKFYTAADKAVFGNLLVDFIRNDFPEYKWTKQLYKQLCQTFGHIAHFDQHGFWAAQLETMSQRLEFIVGLLRWPCYGSREFTFCDVEAAVQGWLREDGTYGRLQQRSREADREARRTAYEHLKQEFEPQPGASTQPTAIQATEAFKVVATSTNTNAFGLYQQIFLSRTRAMRGCASALNRLAPQAIITVSAADPLGGLIKLGFECPEFIETPSEEVLADVWAPAPQLESAAT